MKSLATLLEEINLFESQFSNWEYRLPKDPETMLYDFYFLSKFINDPNTGDDDLEWELNAKEGFISVTAWKPVHPINPPVVAVFKIDYKKASITYGGTL